MVIKCVICNNEFMSGFLKETPCTACPNCGKKIFKDLHPSWDGSFSGGAQFSEPHWSASVKKIKELEMKKDKSATCFCCGIPCKDWGSTVSSTCETCATKIHKYASGSGSWSASFFSNYENGDGFPTGDTWTPLILKVKLECENEKSKPNQETMAIDNWDLIQGDRVEIEIADRSQPKGSKVEGTFLATDNEGNAIIYLDETYDTSNHSSSSWYDHSIASEDLRKIAAKYGINSGREESNLWTVPEQNSYSNTNITKILKHQKAKVDKKMPIDRSTGHEIGWMEIIAKDSGKAAIRSGATLGIDGLKVGIKQMLTSQGVAGPGITAVMEFFDTKLGDAALRAGLGYSLLGMPIPYIQENEYAQQISEELRVSGQSGGMDQVAAMVKMFILPALMEAFKNTPIMKGIEESANKARVAESVSPQRIASSDPQATEGMEIEEDPFASVPKRAVA